MNSATGKKGVRLLVAAVCAAVIVGAPLAHVGGAYGATTSGAEAQASDAATKDARTKSADAGNKKDAVADDADAQDADAATEAAALPETNEWYESAVCRLPRKGSRHP